MLTQIHKLRTLEEGIAEEYGTEGFPHKVFQTQNI